MPMASSKVGVRISLLRFPATHAASVVRSHSAGNECPQREPRSLIESCGSKPLAVVTAKQALPAHFGGVGLRQAFTARQPTSRRDGLDEKC